MINQAGVRPLFILSNGEDVADNEYQTDLFRLAYYLDYLDESYSNEIPTDWQYKGLKLHLEQRLKNLDNQSYDYFETCYICYAIGLDI